MNPSSIPKFTMHPFSVLNPEIGQKYRSIGKKRSCAIILWTLVGTAFAGIGGPIAFFLSSYYFRRKTVKELKNPAVPLSSGKTDRFARSNPTFKSTTENVSKKDRPSMKDQVQQDFYDRMKDLNGIGENVTKPGSSAPRKPQPFDNKPSKSTTDNIPKKDSPKVVKDEVWQEFCAEFEDLTKITNSEAFKKRTLDRLSSGGVPKERSDQLLQKMHWLYTLAALEVKRVNTLISFNVNPTQINQLKSDLISIRRKLSSSLDVGLNKFIQLSSSEQDKLLAQLEDSLGDITVAREKIKIR